MLAVMALGLRAMSASVADHMAARTVPARAWLVCPSMKVLPCQREGPSLAPSAAATGRRQCCVVELCCVTQAIYRSPRDRALAVPLLRSGSETTHPEGRLAGEGVQVTVDVTTTIEGRMHLLAKPSGG